MGWSNARPPNTRKKRGGLAGGLPGLCRPGQDADSKDTEANRSTDDACTPAGAEFSCVCLRGPGQGLFPSYRPWKDPSALEERRRLCYVGINDARSGCSSPTPAKAALGRHARSRRAVGCFLSELPPELIQGDIPQSGGASHPAGAAAGSPLGSIARTANGGRRWQPAAPANAVRRRAPARTWGDWRSIAHASFGDGTITHLFGSGEKILDRGESLRHGAPKILDPRLARLSPA